jgi:hypothetical protein
MLRFFVVNMLFVSVSLGFQFTFVTKQGIGVTKTTNC